jgi:hypothetical protein
MYIGCPSSHPPIDTKWTHEFLTSIHSLTVGVSAKSQCLALRVLDVAYLPKSSTAAVTSSSTSTLTTKRSNRWSSRVDSTPSKRMRISEPDERHANDSGSPSHTCQVSPSPTPGDRNLSPVSSIPSNLSNSDRRPQREKRRLPKRYRS